MITDEQAQANKIRMQEEGYKAWVDAGMRGTLAWATGVGKSRAAILCMIYLENFNLLTGKTPKGLLVTPTEEMRDTDWPEEFLKWNFDPAGTLKSICYASLHKEVLADYDYIIYDECHRITLANLQKLFYFKGPVLGLTATFPKYKYEDEEERVGLLTELMPPVHTITTDQAVDLGLISDFEVYVLQFYLDAVTRNIQGGTKKKPAMVTEKMQYTKLTRAIQLATFKKIDALKFAMISKRTQLIYNLPSKLRVARACLEKMMKDKLRTLVLCGSIDVANQLCGANVFHSESSSMALDLFQEEKIHVMAAVKALNEGKNLVNLEQELIEQVDSQERNLVQRIGRALRKRLGRPLFKARIVILVVLNTCDEKWYKSAIKDFDSVRIKRMIIRVPDVEKSPPESAVIRA